MCVVCILSTTMKMLLKVVELTGYICKCGRWLHEDCVEEVIKDSEGVECYCSFLFE